MPNPSQTNPPGDQPSRVGRTRTWWHPILVRMLRWALGEGYDVREEVSVGEIPLRIDVLVVELDSGVVPEWAKQYLSELLTRLRNRTFIELKGPNDGLQSRDWELLMAYGLLYLHQEPRRLANGDISLIFLAPAVTASFRDGLADRGLSLQPEVGEPGIFRIDGGMFETWMIETDEMARRHRPILSLVSRHFLRRPRDIIKELAKLGFGPILSYVVQQIRQFGASEEIAMQFSDTDSLIAVDAELRDAMLQILPILTPEERLQGLAPEERLKGLAPEERLKGLSPSERRKLRELLDQTEEGSVAEDH